MLTVRQQRIVLDAVDRQLAHQPAVETRNRKPMRPNPLAPWELRIGNLRVYDMTRRPSQNPWCMSGPSESSFAIGFASEGK